MRWQEKCFIDNCKAVLPFQDRLRGLKRRIFGYQANAENAPGTLADGLKQVEWVGQHLGTLKDSAVLEIGTGWEPIIPLVYRLAGAKVVYLTDSTRLICEQSLDAALNFLTGARDQVCAALRISQINFNDLLARGRNDRGIESRLKALDLQYLAPVDCRSLHLDSGSIDIIFSRAVLEHVPEAIVREILRESTRLLTPGGAICHFVDNSDHWEHRDKSISRVNFLQHGELLWRFTCLNPLNYQNRLRHQDYLAILGDEGFRVVRAERKVDAESLRLIPNMSLAAQFKGKPHDDLATISSYLLAIAVSQ